jgi:hypothetical protein
MQLLSLLVGVAFLAPGALSQTWTDCNPLNVTCPDNPALGTSHNFVFNTSSSVTDTFNITAGSLVYGSSGTQFIVNKRGDSPTIQSKFYIFFGSVSVIMQTATGQGIISSIVLESDDLDEVDWEFLGGNSTHAETNYFGKGNTTSFGASISFFKLRLLGKGCGISADLSCLGTIWTALCYWHPAPREMDVLSGLWLT